MKLNIVAMANCFHQAIKHTLGYPCIGYPDVGLIEGITHMNARQQYAMAYRKFRKSKGSAVLHASSPVARAWKSYKENFQLLNDDPLKTDSQRWLSNRDLYLRIVHTHTGVSFKKAIRDIYRNCSNYKRSADQWPKLLREVHYVAMAGLHGCLPDYCQSFDNRGNCVDYLADWLDLDNIVKREFELTGYTDLSLLNHGVQYAEIIECDCDDPSVHNDD